MANNDFNLFKWDYSSGKTWGYMGAGALIGAASGAVGSAILSTGAPLSNTMSIIASSYLNSMGTAAYTGGKTDVGFSFGIGSVNLTKNQIRGLWNWKDLTLMEKFGYTAGALTNIQDVAARTSGADVTVKARPKLAGHSEINGKYKTDDILISVGPNGDPYPNLNGMKWEYKFFQLQMKGTPHPGENMSYINSIDPQIKTKLFNVAGDLMTKWTNKLNSGDKLIGSTRLTYGLNNGC